MSAEDSTISDVRVAALESENASLRGELARTRDALASLRARYHQIIEELHLLKRRLHVAKAERLDDVADAQLAFDRLTAEADALEKVLDVARGDADAGAPPPPPSNKARKKSSAKPTGRRKLSDFDLPEVASRSRTPSSKASSSASGSTRARASASSAEGDVVSSARASCTRTPLSPPTRPRTASPAGGPGPLGPSRASTSASRRCPRRS
jgi:hypothetical protein